MLKVEPMTQPNLKKSFFMKFLEFESVDSTKQCSIFESIVIRLESEARLNPFHEKTGP